MIRRWGNLRIVFGTRFRLLFAMRNGRSAVAKCMVRFLDLLTSSACFDANPSRKPMTTGWPDFGSQ
jgi:hypothetical protein